MSKEENKENSPKEDPVKEPVFETVSSSIRTEQGAEIRRLKVEKKPETLQQLKEHLDQKQKELLAEALKGVQKNPLAKPDPIVLAMKELSVILQKEPSERIRLGHSVNTYMVIQEERKKLVVRVYAHIPAAFNKACLEILKGFPAPIEFSKDSFIRPSGI